MQTIFSNLGVVLAAFFATLAAFAIQRFTEYLKVKKRGYYNLEHERNIHVQINQVLVELLVELSADRAYIAQFHNGTVFLGSSTDIKKSRTFERVRPGVSYVSERFQDLRLSLMDDEIQFVNSEKPTLIYINGLNDTKFRRMMEMGGVYCTVRFPLRVNNQILGFLGIDFDACEYKDTPSHKHCHELGIKDAAQCCKLGDEKVKIIMRVGRVIQELISQMKHHR